MHATAQSAEPNIPSSNSTLSLASSGIVNITNITGMEPTPLIEILHQRKLTALFQPILDLSSGEFLGYEGLIRGPANSPMHSPANLFSTASEQGLSLEMEMLCRQVVLETFSRLNLPGNLFLNVSPETLTHPSFKNGQTLEYLTQLGISPERVIIEITENQPTYDFVAMRSALLHYRSMGFKIAIDDLGEGFSSLRLWSELRPEFIKIDMHFVQGVDTDPIKRQFLKSIQQIALSCGTNVIAEGVETEAELKVVKDIGIALGQGYFIARPSPTPSLLASTETSRIIKLADVATSLKLESTTPAKKTAQQLITYIPPSLPSTENDAIFDRFCESTSLRVIPIVANGIPVGLINRSHFMDMISRPFQRELHGRKPCEHFMHASPLLVDKSMPIEELSEFLAQADEDQFGSGFIVTDQGRYLGMSSCQNLLRELTQMQIAAARYANPLTLLPGNVPINQQIDHLLQTLTPFVACYCDLDHFKPYNDVYGFHKGDEMIQLTGRVLNWACDPKLDFIGHIGGDDFILLMRSKDWKSRCEQALRSFEQAASLLFTPEHIMAGGYQSEDRNDKVIFHSMTSLSIGAVAVAPGQYLSHNEVSAAATQAKKMAKRTKGNSLFIEPRSSSTK